MTVNIVSQSQYMLDGIFLARATYGGEYIAPAFDIGGDNDAERNDDYRGYVASQGSGWQLLDASDLPTFNNHGGDDEFTSGGLYNAVVHTGITNSHDAQGLLAVQGDTLVMSFRGTDGEDPAVLSGQTFVGSSLAANYKAFEGLIDAAYDYLAAHPDIHHMVVSGHSLGGAMVDLFTLTDAARFRALLDGGLTIISIASSGVPKDTPEYLDNVDTSVATIKVKSGISTITALTPPDDYVSLASDHDRARFAKDFPDVPEALGLVPILTLKDNLHFGADVVVSNPNINNKDVTYHNPLTHPYDFRGIGAQHSSALMWVNMQGLLTDTLKADYTNQHIIFGIDDYAHAKDWDGDTIRLFKYYNYLDTAGNDNDSGAKSLIGTAGADYILGLSGNDTIRGGKGADLLSGGDGSDTLSYQGSAAVTVNLALNTASGGDAAGDKIAGFENLIGGAGNDVLTGSGLINRLNGGGGNDTLTGLVGKDTLTGGTGSDTFVYSAIIQSKVGTAHDVITDFSQADHDHISLSAIDADTGTTGNQVFNFIDTAAFDVGVAGELRAFQQGDQVIVQGDVNGDGKADFEIALTGHMVLTALDFIL